MQLTFSERFRSLLQNPATAVERFGVAAGMRVADLGAGRGYLTIPAAMAAGREGMVFAVEPDSARAAAISRRAASEGLQNIQVLTTGAEHLDAIPSATIDLAFSAFSIHHFTDQKAAMAEISRVLKPGHAFYVWDRVPGMIARHGTHPDDLQRDVSGFSRFELLDAGRTLRARYTK